MRWKHYKRWNILIFKSKNNSVRWQNLQWRWQLVLAHAPYAVQTSAPYSSQSSILSRHGSLLTTTVVGGGVVVVVVVVVDVVVAESSMKEYYVYSDWNVKKSKCLEQKYFGRAPACFHSDIKAVHIGNNFIKTLYSLMHLPVTIVLNYLFISITNICFKKVVPNVNSYMYSSCICKNKQMPNLITSVQNIYINISKEWKRFIVGMAIIHV